MFIIINGKVLIIKRADNDEFGEDLATALVRKSKEEVGLDITVKNILYATTVKTDPTRQVVIITYLCRSNKNEVVLSSECIEYKWATKDQLRQLLFLDIIKDCKKVTQFLSNKDS